MNALRFDALQLAKPSIMTQFCVACMFSRNFFGRWLHTVSDPMLAEGAFAAAINEQRSPPLWHKLMGPSTDSDAVGVMSRIMTGWH